MKVGDAIMLPSELFRLKQRASPFRYLCFFISRIDGESTKKSERCASNRHDKCRLVFVELFNKLLFKDLFCNSCLLYPRDVVIGRTYFVWIREATQTEWNSCFAEHSVELTTGASYKGNSSLILVRSRSFPDYPNRCSRISAKTDVLTS